MGCTVTDSPPIRRNSIVAVVVLHWIPPPFPLRSIWGVSDDKSTGWSFRQAFTAHDSRHNPVRRSNTRRASAT
eukprot:scaffold1112_cov92-Amphora_coffeaeformis.AAC.7